MRGLWALDHALHRTSKRMAAVLGVTGPQRLVIRLIGRQARMTAGELARTMHVHPSTLTGVLARLEGAGLLRRQTDSVDRRLARLALTRAGRRIDLRTAGTIEAAIGHVLSRTSPADVEAAGRLLASVTAALQQSPAKRSGKRSARVRKDRRLGSDD